MVGKGKVRRILCSLFKSIFFCCSNLAEWIIVDNVDNDVLNLMLKLHDKCISRSGVMDQILLNFFKITNHYISLLILPSFGSLHVIVIIVIYTFSFGRKLLIKSSWKIRSFFSNPVGLIFHF